MYIYDSTGNGKSREFGPNKLPGHDGREFERRRAKKASDWHRNGYETGRFAAR